MAEGRKRCRRCERAELAFGRAGIKPAPTYCPDFTVARLVDPLGVPVGLSRSCLRSPAAATSPSTAGITSTGVATARIAASVHVAVGVCCRHATLHRVALNSTGELHLNTVTISRLLAGSERDVVAVQRTVDNEIGTTHRIGHGAIHTVA